MKIKKDVLQQLINNNGEYFIAERFIEGMGAARGKDERKALFISPNIPRELWDKNLHDLAFSAVDTLINTDLLTNIYLGQKYPPFQWGVKYGELINVAKVTCKPNELIYKCYIENITDYWKVLTAMEELTIKKSNSCMKHDCNQNIESNMSSAHCRVCKKNMSDTIDNPEEKPDKVYWLTNSKSDFLYKTTTWYRCMKGQDFVELVEKENTIVGIIFSDNNIGFILDDKHYESKNTKS